MYFPFSRRHAILQDGGLRIYTSSLTAGYVIPIRRGLLPPLISKFAGASHTNPHEGTAKEREGRGEAQNDLQYRGLLPPISGGRKFAPPFFEFWARGIRVQTPQSEPLTTCA